MRHALHAEPSRRKGLWDAVARYRVAVVWRASRCRVAVRWRPVECRRVSHADVVW
jgi:hypothetical protein